MDNYDKVIFDLDGTLLDYEDKVVVFESRWQGVYIINPCVDYWY